MSVRSLFNTAYLVLALVILATLGGTAMAEPAAGGLCSSRPAGTFMRVGGPETAGAGDFLVCDGTNWGSVLRYSSSGEVYLLGGNIGIGTNVPAARLDVAGGVKMTDDAVACTATNEGTQRYNTTSKAMEFCNGTTWAAVGGGGGGGGNIVSSVADVGHGGGGGGFSTILIAAGLLGATETVTIGAGGAGGAAWQTSGTAGGTTTFGSVCSASGGTSGGFGGTGSGGDINGFGSSGFRPYATSWPGKIGGNGGDSHFSGGGKNNGGASGVGSLGSGGSGGAADLSNNTTFAGGAGGDGVVIVREFF